MSSRFTEASRAYKLVRRIDVDLANSNYATRFVGLGHELTPWAPIYRVHFLGNMPPLISKPPLFRVYHLSDC